jgi:hypothetical protein
LLQNRINFFLIKNLLDLSNFDIEQLNLFLIDSFIFCFFQINILPGASNDIFDIHLIDLDFQELVDINLLDHLNIVFFQECVGLFDGEFGLVHSFLAALDVLHVFDVGRELHQVDRFVVQDLDVLVLLVESLLGQVPHELVQVVLVELEFVVYVDQKTVFYFRAVQSQNVYVYVFQKVQNIVFLVLQFLKFVFIFFQLELSLSQLFLVGHLDPNCRILLN